MLTKYPTSPFVTNGSDELPLFSIDFIDYQLQVYICSIIIYILDNTKVYILSCFFAFPYSMGRLVMMASSHSKNIALKKATIYSFKLQQTIEGKLQSKLHSILACPYASKHLTLRHKGNTKHIQRTLVAWRCGKSSFTR